MQVQETRTENTGSPGTRHRPPLASIFHRRKITAAVLLLLLTATAALIAISFWSRRFQARDHWRQALNAIEARDFPLAQTHLNSCLEANPLNAEAHFLMARTCRRMDDFEGWGVHLPSAAILGWPAEQIDLELLLKEAQVGNIWKVEPQLQSYLTAGHPEEVLIVEALVKGYLEYDLPKKAFDLTKDWINNYPDDWQARYYQGRACRVGVRFEEAIANFEEVLRLKPNQPETLLELAQTLTSYTQFDRAMERYRDYLKLRPGDTEALLGLARCQFTQGDRDSARATLDELLRRDPHHLAGLFLRAQLEQAESPEKALPWLRRAVALAPYKPDLLHNLILALRALHQDPEADQLQQREKISRQKENELIDLQRQLVQEADKVNVADLRYRIAVLHLELGHEEKETAHWFQTVLYLDPNHRPTLRTLADYWEKHGNKKRADHYRELAEGKQP